MSLDRPSLTRERWTRISDASGLSRIAGSYTAAFVAVMALAALAVLLTFDDYGVTWDEHVQNEYGKMVLNYYVSGFGDKSALTYFDLWAYGGLFDLVAAICNKISPLGEYETRHLLNALVGLAGVVGCWKLARALAGERVAFWSALLLLVMPTWYGHMFNNPKDVPFAVFFVWSLYYIVRIASCLPRPPLSLVARLGLMIGLSLGVRVGGLLLFGYICLVGLGFVAARYWQTRNLAQLGRDTWVGSYRVILPVFAIAYPVMLLFWPWAQAAPFSNPVAALMRFQHLPFNIPVKFFGGYFVSTDPPWYYLPVELLFRLPEIVLPLAALTCVFAFLALKRRRDELPLGKALEYGALAVAIVFPLVYVVVAHVNLFDGMRHFTFLLPPIAVAGGIGMDRLLDVAARQKLNGVAYLLIVAFLAYHASIMVRLHPDQYVYYNRYAGGLKSAAKRFELDYWANSFAEAVDALEDELREQYGPDFENHRFKIKVCDSPFSASYYFP
ncbi:MAG TPA: glycosyltransferase family 39 protein, partial [Candidatus Cybelea sp.]|nr:glycosyltransferase family 39 protein [Candidatus Cybelea sp.]